MTLEPVLEPLNQVCFKCTTCSKVLIISAARYLLRLKNNGRSYTAVYDVIPKQESRYPNPNWAYRCQVGAGLATLFQMRQEKKSETQNLARN